MDTTLDSGGASWEQAAQGWGTMLLDRYTAATYVPPSQQAMTNTQRGATGKPYVEGQPTAINVGGMKVSPMLLIGAAVAVGLFFALRK